jgi:hypothetical protein
MNLNIDIYYFLLEFLNISDIKNLLITNKFLYNDKKYKSFCINCIKNRSSNILIRFWRIYINRCKYINRDDIFLTKRIIAFYFFRYYEKRYWNLWYNNNIEWKKRIIDKYKKTELNEISRLDMFNLILKIPVEDMVSIGW